MALSPFISIYPELIFLPFLFYLSSVHPDVLLRFVILYVLYVIPLEQRTFYFILNSSTSPLGERFLGPGTEQLTQTMLGPRRRGERWYYNVHQVLLILRPGPGTIAMVTAVNVSLGSWHTLVSYSIIINQTPCAGLDNTTNK